MTLTPREAQILELLANEGLTNPAIGELTAPKSAPIWDMPVVGTPEYDAWVEAEEAKAMEL